MKSRFLGSIAILSAIAFINCSDETLTAATSDAVVDEATATGELSVPQESAGGENTDFSQSGSYAEELAESLNVDVSSLSVNDVLDSALLILPDNPLFEIPVDISSSSLVEDSGSGPIAISSSSQIIELSSSSENVDNVQQADAQMAPGIFLAGSDETKDGPLAVSVMENVGPDGGGILAYPTEMSTDPNKKHAVVIWGPGGGTEPGAYMGIINRLASHGFVVFALSSSPGDASKAIPAMDWLSERNDLDYGVLSGKLDMSKVGCSGHSMGGLESEQALIKDRRVVTAMLNNSGDLGHSGMAQVSTDRTIAVVYGNNGMERPNAEGDYNNSNVKAPACLIMMEGADWGHGSGPWGGMAATVAWMRWHLGGETERKADFVGTSGKYINGSIVGESGNWNGQCKNF